MAPSSRTRTSSRTISCQRWSVEAWGLRSLAAAGSSKPTPFDGADGADALQGIGPQWPSDGGNDDRWRRGDAMGVVRLLKEQQPDI